MFSSKRLFSQVWLLFSLEGNMGSCVYIHNKSYCIGDLKLLFLVILHSSQNSVMLEVEKMFPPNIFMCIIFRLLHLSSNLPFHGYRLKYLVLFPTAPLFLFNLIPTILLSNIIFWFILLCNNEWFIFLSDSEESKLLAL